MDKLERQVFDLLPDGSSISSVGDGKLFTDEHGWKHRKWVAVIGDETFDYRTGTAHDFPSWSSVIGSLMNDCDIGGNSFEDMCMDFGYDEDSRKNYRLWEGLKETRRKLQRALDSETVSNLAALLEDY